MKTNLSEAKIAIVHDFMTTMGGGERVALALHELFPDAPIYTLRYDMQKMRPWFSKADVRVARLAQTWLGRSAMLALPFLPNAVETLPLAEYDIVISSSSAFSKGVLTKPTTLHISYCHTPMRFVWDWTHEYAKERGYDYGLKSVAYRLITHYLRIWDQASAERVDLWIANSKNVANRITKYYHQPSTVIYPPVNIPTINKSTDPPSTEPYFLIVSRLSGYKKIDLAIEAAAQLKQKLIIIGDGAERDALESLADQLKAPVTFMGHQNDATIARHYEHARAFLFPGEDDFGITPVEAMSYGKPVIAYGKGGALETVIAGKTGIFFDQPTVGSLVDAIDQFIKKENQFDAIEIKKQAEHFSADVFKDKMTDFVTKQWEKFNEKL